MQNRLTKALMQWQLSNTSAQTNPGIIHQLSNFQFTEEMPLQNLFNIPVIITETTGDILQVMIPAFKPKQTIKAPQQTKQIHINIAAGRCSYTQPYQTESVQQKLVIEYNNKLLKQQVIQLPLIAVQHSITVIAVSLNYWVKQQGRADLLKVRQNAWSPAAIMYAISGETIQSS